MQPKGHVYSTIEWQQREWVTTHRPLSMWTKRGLFGGSSDLTSSADYVTQCE